MLIPKAAGDLAINEEFLWNFGGGWRLYRCTGHKDHRFAGPPRTHGVEFWPFQPADRIEGETYIFMAPLQPRMETACCDVELADHTIVFVSSNNQPMVKELTTVC